MDAINHERATRATGGRSKRWPLAPGGGSINFLAPPKLVQWSKEPLQYYEGSTLVLSCSLSQSGGEQPQLKFAWFRNGKPLAGTTQSQLQRLSIETLADYSFLRLADLRPSDLGAYTCVASNSLGQEDRTSTQVIVNVKLKWISGAAGETGGEQHWRDVNRTLLDGDTGHQLIKSRAGQTIVFECNVSGGQRAQIRWFRLAAPAALRQRAGQSGLLGKHAKFENQNVLDETQLKIALNQLDALQGDTQMQRHELANG